MNACVSFLLRINGNDIDKKAIERVIADAVFDGYDVETNDDGDIIVEDHYGIDGIEGLTTLAISMARAAPDSSFIMKGLDNIENSGESMDFEITYKEHKLTVMSSDWYEDYYVDNDISYEEFCEEWDFDETWASDEEFEAAKNEGNGIIFVCPSYSGKLVSKIELSDITTIEI